MTVAYQRKIINVNIPIFSDGQERTSIIIENPA